MDKIKVTCLNRSHEDPENFLNNIVRITFSKKLSKTDDMAKELLDRKNDDFDLLINTIKMNHQSILEHVNVTYAIEGASRSFLAQITRHRLFSFLSASQHYMDYSDMADFVVPVEIQKQGPTYVKEYLEACKKSIEEYKSLIDKGIDHSVARQVLPNGMKNQLIITGNLRQWKNFLNLRLCGRNTSEIEYVAYLIKEDLNKYVPTIAKYMVPDCVLLNKCTQGNKSCGTKYSDENEKEKFDILCKKK